VAHGGAALLGLERTELRVGDPADFVLLPGDSVAQVVVDRPVPSLVVRAGRVIARDGQLVDGGQQRAAGDRLVEGASR
jgi:cytosine deaminase